MYRASHDYSAARAVLHIALPSMQISWRFVSTAGVALLGLLGSIIVQGALGASRAVAQAAATVAPQPHILVLPAHAAHPVQLAPQLAAAPETGEHEQSTPASVAPPHGLLAHALLGLRPAYARVAQRRQRLVGRR
ncbi:MAG: hypothetical protein H7Y32_15635 [Chloroflexales bacterium]|nr:hypothetical protein [Chloroflexales bacterium]